MLILVGLAVEQRGLEAGIVGPATLHWTWMLQPLLEDFEPEVQNVEPTK